MTNLDFLEFTLIAVPESGLSWCITNENRDYLLNSTFNSSNPLSFDGDDNIAQCEFPCKVKCNKKIWTEKDDQTWNQILDRDLDIHPECSLPENIVSLPSQVNIDTLETSTNLPFRETKSKSDQRFVMANLKQKIKDILNSKQNASANKIIWNDW